MYINIDDNFLNKIVTEFSGKEFTVDDLRQYLPQKIKNKGTGAGGSNTNKNGLLYENQKDINTEYDIIDENKNYTIIKFKNYDKKFITGTKKQFMKYLDDLENKNIKKLHGTKEPDNWFINDNNIFILELKFQQCNGSTCEKLQTPEKKIRNLERRYPNKKVHYIYGLAEWFRNNCPAEIDDFIEDNIPHFWGDDKNFKDNIINYIINNS